MLRSSGLGDGGADYFQQCARDDLVESARDYLVESTMESGIHEVECTPVVLVYVRPYHHLNWCDSADLPEFKEVDKHDNAKTLKNNA